MKTSMTTLLISMLVIMSSFVQSPFSAIVSANPALYSTYQIKITYTSYQLKSRRSLLLTGIGRLPSISEFAPYRTAGISYNNDHQTPIQLAVAGASIKKFVDAVSLRSELKINGGSNEPTLSVMIEKGVAPTEVVFEHLTNAVESHTMLNLLEAAMTTESASAKSALQTFRNYTIGHH